MYPACVCRTSKLKLTGAHEELTRFKPLPDVLLWWNDFEILERLSTLPVRTPPPPPPTPNWIVTGKLHYLGTRASEAPFQRYASICMLHRQCVQLFFFFYRWFIISRQCSKYKTDGTQYLMMKFLTTLSIKMTDTNKVKCSSGFQHSESEKKTQWGTSADGDSNLIHVYS